MAAFLAALLGPIIRPIIQEEIGKLKQFVADQFGRLQTYEKVDLETVKLIEFAEKATTTEEVKAHVRRLKETRARFNM